MKTIATLFTGILAFFSSLLGHTPSQTLQLPTVVVSSTSSTQEIKQSIIGTTTITQATSSQNFVNFHEDISSKDVSKLVAIIQSDNDNNAEILYTTKAKNRIYFIRHSESDSDPNCLNLQYLDTIENKYHNFDTQYCPRGVYTVSPKHEQSTSSPYFIQEGKFDFKNLYMLNLESATETIIYSIKNQNDSLVSGCYYMDGTWEFIGKLPYIEYINNNMIRIGVYKEIGKDEKQCTVDTQAKYEKIRDDIIDLSKF